MTRVGVVVGGLLSVGVTKVRMGYRQARGIFARCNRLRSMVVLVEAMIGYSQGGGYLIVPMTLCVHLKGQ